MNFEHIMIEIDDFYRYQKICIAVNIEHYFMERNLEKITRM